MKKKVMALFIAICFAISLFPMHVFAADITITTNGTYDISNYGNNSTITICKKTHEISREFFFLSQVIFALQSSQQP